MTRRIVSIASIISTIYFAMFTQALRAEDAPPLTHGGYTFLPVYSNILIGDNARPFPLAVNVCLRNTSLQEEVSLIAVDYYDSEGKLLKKYLQNPQVMKALSSVTFTVAESEKLGGAGAKFIIRWRSAKPAPAPLAEAVMVGTANQQGISFTSRGLNHLERP